jgi:hypothetical protein
VHRYIIAPEAEVNVTQEEGVVKQSSKGVLENFSEVLQNHLS